jgi:hypothetical protein
MRLFLHCLPLLIFLQALAWSAVPVQGERKRWHKLTLDFSGPATSESATPNPFSNYRLDVTFTHAGSGKSYLVPGYYAADGNAANSSASSGNVWRVHFAPDETGTWTYTASFRSGTNIATIGTTGSSAGFFDGDTGSFSIEETDKTGRDFRGKGRLEYVGKHHLRFAGTGDYFMKTGVDAPENFLAYADFDGGFKSDGTEDDLIKTWSFHTGDWQSGDPVWQGSKGKGMIGAINYLAAEGLNAFSFLTMNINGDDKNVFPYITSGDRTRLDVSRMDQWGIAFDHGTRNGMHLNFKTQEIENQNLLDGGDLGNQRILYYRELIARFGHNLGLNWNLGEECTATTVRKKAWAQFFHDNDPYRHPIVIHNTTSVLHREMMGDASKLTGFSLQLNAPDFTDMFAMTKDYIDRSVAAGKPWVVACDEPGDSRFSLRPDNDPGSSHTDARKHALWGNIMAGGAGVEWYFGYALDHSDLTCEDFRSRDSFWPVCRYTLEFLESSDVPFENMKNQNSLVSGSGSNANRCLAKTGAAYLVHLPSGGSATLNLSAASGSFSVKWFNPRTGAVVNRSDINGGGTVSLGSPPDTTTQDWVVFLRSGSGGGEGDVNQAPVANAGPDATAVLSGASVSVILNGVVTDDGLPTGSSPAVSWTRVSGPAAVAFTNATAASTSATFNATGTYVLRLSADDGDLTDSDEVTIVVNASGGTGGDQSFSPIHDAYTNNGGNYNTSGLRVENGTRVRIAYLQFDLGSIGVPSSAVLRLTEGDDPSSGEMTIRLYAAASNNWTESAINGSNAPAKGALLDTFTGDIPNNLAINFNVAAHVTGPGIYSFIVETDSTVRSISFASSENSATANRPLLFITSGGEPVNQAPLVNAGPDRSAVLAGGSVSLDLAGTVSDDGLPVDSALETFWVATDGPDAVIFTDDADPGTTVSFTEAGVYTLELNGSDGELAASDVVVISVGDPASNLAPAADAGPDKTATLVSGAAIVALAGSATDDGLPAGSTLNHAWTRISGPAAVTFSSPGTAATDATFTVSGNYVLRLSVSDSQLAGSDDVAVTVSAPAATTPTPFPAVHDAYLQNGTNYNNNDLRIESTSRSRITYLQFDLSDLDASPATARLRLTEGSDTSGGTMTLRLFAASSNDWTESGINGNNAPAKGIELDSFSGDIPNGRVVEFDVSSLVTGPGIYSFILQADASTRDVAFASSENSTVGGRPQLVVALSDPSPGGDGSGETEPPALPVTGLSLEALPGEGGIQLRFDGVAGMRYVIQRSTDLVDWEPLHATTLEDAGPIEFVDPAPPAGRGFYRVTSEP